MRDPILAASVARVGIPLSRAVLCPNDETIYDAQRFALCPTCENEERISLAKVLGQHYPAAALTATPRRIRAC